MGTAPDIATMSAWPQLGITPGPVLRIFGMRRSGNHAVINWLARNAPGGRSLFFNDCTPGRKPFETYRAVEIDGERVAGNGGDPVKLAARAGDGTALMFSYEDAMPNERRRRPVSVGVDEALISHEVVICRGILNWAASLLKKVQGNDAYSAAERVAIVLKALGGYARMLELAMAEDELGVVVIRYEPWMTDAGYRAGLLERLGFEARDDSLGEVQRYGNGSSFQADAGAVDELNTLDRWKEMRDDPEYRIIMWLAAQDEALCGKLETVYPDDARQLVKLRQSGQAGRAPQQNSAQDTAQAQILRRN
ncbi:hypothetical protein [Roseovarius sp.]|uniref:hypothetical protein n=1 Tax=Roseovarius sp. TaxID=1486281 RepID=UPI002616628D|nr:hypothetical protein [Roseovarius sp.]MDM8167224.1 hypothetical protein [Roseovarius sp.]